MKKTTYEELLGSGSSRNEVFVFEDEHSPDEKPKLLISSKSDCLCINFLKKSEDGFDRHLLLNRFFVLGIDDIRELKEILKGYW